MTISDGDDTPRLPLTDCWPSDCRSDRVTDVHLRLLADAATEALKGVGDLDRAVARNRWELAGVRGRARR